MNLDTKTVVIICIVVVGLFAGGLTYIFRENSNRRVVLDLMQQYISSRDEEAKKALESQIKDRLNRRSLALTSKASFDSFEDMLNIAQRCDHYASQRTFNPRQTENDYDNVWRECMNNPEVLQGK